MIFLLNISQGRVPCYNVEFSYDGRRGRSIVPKPIVKPAPAMVRNARERIMGVRGAHIYNLLPEDLRSLNTDHEDLFKNHLDVFLSSVLSSPQ